MSANPVVRRLARLRRWQRVVLILLLVWLVVVAGLCSAIYAFGQVDHAQSADVIIVLGAGLNSDNEPGSALIRRANHAAALWQQGLAAAIICTGGVTGRTTTRSEASACGELLSKAGVPGEAIFLEEQSRSTEENAIYSDEIMQAQGWTSAVLVSDSFHMLRAQWLFQQRGMKVVTSPVPVSQMGPLDYGIAVAREIAAFHWQVFKQALHLPITSVGRF